MLAFIIPVMLAAACVSGIATTHVRGSENATVTIIEFSDFQCPACGMAEPIVEQVLEAYPTQVKLIYKDFPLPMHSYAQKASEAAECAGEQGKYWEMHDVLFANQDALKISDLKSYAADLGLNTTVFNACLDSGATAGDVKADLKEGQSRKITGTPSFFINGQEMVGAYPFETWKSTIDGLLNL